MSNPPSRSSNPRAQSVNQSLNRSNRPVANQSTNQSINQSTDHSPVQSRVIRSQPVNDQLRLPNNRSLPRSPIPTINQPINQSVNQSINQSSKQSSVERQPLINNQSQRSRPQSNQSVTRPVSRPLTQPIKNQFDEYEDELDDQSIDQSMFARRVHVNGRSRQSTNPPIHPSINPSNNLPKRAVRGGPAYTGVLLVIIALTLLIIIHKLSQSINPSTSQTTLGDHKHDHSFPGKIDPSVNQYLNAGPSIRPSNNPPIIEAVTIPDLPAVTPVEQPAKDQSINQPTPPSNDQPIAPPSEPKAEVTLPKAEVVVPIPSKQPVDRPVKPSESNNQPPSPPAEQFVDPLQEAQSDDPATKLLKKLKQSVDKPSDQSVNQLPPIPESPNQQAENDQSRLSVKASTLDTSIIKRVPANSRTLLQHEMPVDKLPYQPTSQPIALPINGPDSHVNQERRDQLSESQLTVSLPGQITQLCSPANKLCIDLSLNAGGDVEYSVNQGVNRLIDSAVSAVTVHFKSCQFAPSVVEVGSDKQKASVNARLYSGSSYWKPVPGAEKRYSYAEYNSILLSCKGAGCRNCPVKAELRVFDEGVAVRHLVNLPDRDVIAIVSGIAQAQKAAGQALNPEEMKYIHVQHVLDVKLADKYRYSCWGNSQEEPYIEQVCASMPETMTPITIVATEKESINLNQLFMSILQADGPNFLRSVASGSSVSQSVNQSVDAMQIMSRGEILTGAQEGQIGVLHFDDVIGLTQPTDWHVILISQSIGGLLETNHIVPLLCPPPNTQLSNMADTRWIGMGKSIRERRFDKPEATEMAIEAVDFAQRHNFQIIHFDAGWYGDEYSPKSSALDVFPAFKPNLNMTTIGLNATARGMLFTVYVNELGLRDAPDLARIYSQEWHIHGVKFGFVNTLTPRSMRVLAQRIIEFGKYNMFINIHDLYRPKGWSRTWPHLVAQEGIRGEERKPEADHHTQLAFVRFIQGAADYTPRYLKGSGLLCTRTHQLALPIIFFSPIQSMYWAHPFKALRDAVEKWNPELIMWKMMPTVWDDTRVLSGAVSSHAVIGRRTGQEWFVGVITNNEARTIDVNLTDLFVDRPGHPRSLLSPPIKGYLVHIFTDNAEINADEFPERNLIPQNRRVTYHLPTSMSSDLENVAPITGLPNESVAYVKHLQTQAAYRKTLWNEHDDWMINVKHVKILKDGPFSPIGQPIISVAMPPSGGAVLYIQPYE